MASPFQMFRRRQKALLAFFGVAIMIVFVISGALPNLGSSNSPSAKNAVVVTTEYGPLRESELHNLVMLRRAVDQVLQTIVATSITTLVQNKQIPAGREQAAMDNMMTQLRQEILQRYHMESEEEAAVETLVLAKRAEQMGVVVSDQAIESLLREITRNSDGSQILTSKQLGDILTSVRPDGFRISQSRMFDLFRQEMLAAKLSRMFQASMNGLTPGQRWGYFEQLNRQASAQVLGVKVANFISQVDDPTDKEIQELYKKYEAVIPSPESPEPGFKEPVKARFQYFEANYDKLVALAKEKVTDEEIQKYYDEHKETEFRTLDLPPVKKKPSEDDADDKEDAKSDGEKTPDAEKPAEPDDSKAHDANTGDAKPNDENNELKPDAGKEAPKSDADSKQGGKKDAGKQSAAPSSSHSPFRLVSTQAEGDKPADEKAAADQPAEDKAGGDKPAADKPADEKASGDEPAGEKPSAEGETEVEKPKFDSLEKVRDTIVNRLASDKARDATDKAFANVESAMQEYANQYVLYSAKKESDPSATPPAQLDLDKLAKDNGIDAYSTELISEIEANGTALGKSYNIERDPRSPIGFRQITFESFAFSDRLPLLRPSRTFDDAQNNFLFWKIEQVAEHTPPLDSIKPQVVRACKMDKARALAEKKAQEYADQVKAAKSTLKEVFAKESGLVVTETGPFSWLTMGSAAPFEAGGGQPRVNSVPGVELPGPAFMQKTFSLQPQEVGVALNQPQSIVYVVQLIDYLRPVKDLEEQFAGENFRKYAAAAVPDQRKIYTDWLADVEKAAKVKWDRPPRQNREAM